MALKAGLSCPEELLRGLRQGQNVFELIRLQSTLQCSSSCTVCLGWLLGEERSLCVIKSYQKYKLDDAQLCEVKEGAFACPRRRALMLLFFVLCTWAGRSSWSAMAVDDEIMYYHRAT